MPDDFNSLRIFIAAAMFLAVAGLESVRPALPLTGALGRRWISNIGLYAINTFLTIGLGAIGLSAFEPAVLSASLGLFPRLVAGWPDWWQLLTALLVLDLFTYASHWLLHWARPLWWLHAVHHAERPLIRGQNARRKEPDALAGEWNIITILSKLDRLDLFGAKVLYQGLYHIHLVAFEDLF